MHLIETMSASTGLKIDKPFIQTEEIDLPKKPYITFHPEHNKGTRRLYTKWVEVVKNLTGYDLVQIGSRDGVKYEDYGVNTDYLEKININQLAYLIKHAELHLGYDSFPIHLASYFNVKIVGLWSLYASHSYPYFSDPNSYIMLEPDYDKLGLKPSYKDNDKFRLIDKIKPSDIVDSVNRLMKKC